MEQTITPIEYFLADLFGGDAQGMTEAEVWKIRTPEAFLEAFPPSVLMERITDAALRGRIVHFVAGTQPVIAAKLSPASAAEQISIALASQAMLPTSVLACIRPIECARYLENAALWAFMTEISTRDDEALRKAEGREFADLTKAILILAMRYGLLTSEAFVRAVGFAVFFKNIPADEAIIPTFEAFANAKERERFDAILRITPIEAVVNGALIPLRTLWDCVIHPLIAVRYDLVPSPASADAGSSGGEASGGTENAPPEAGSEGHIPMCLGGIS